MKKTLLSTALLTLLSTATYADNAVQPAAAAQSAAPISTPTPTAGAAGTETAKPSSIPTPSPAAVINCKYHIPAETTSIEPSILSTWAGKAAVESFDFNPATIDEELSELKSCYTDPGWQGFNDALQKSGNINAIKSQHLTVSSQVDGEVKVNALKDNQWKATVPLQVVYQNDKEKLTQLLTIDLLIGRKISGDLGIMQMIATPRQATQPQQPGTPIPTGSAASNGQTQTNPSSQPTTAPSSSNEQKPTIGSQPPTQ